MKRATLRRRLSRAKRAARTHRRRQTRRSRCQVMRRAGLWARLYRKSRPNLSYEQMAERAIAILWPND